MSSPAIPALPPAVIVVLAEIVGAALLWALLTAEATLLVLALFAVMGGAFALIQVRPALEETIVSAFRAKRQMATVIGIAIVLAYPFFLGAIPMRCISSSSRCSIRCWRWR
ncbi:hypothetical protein [Shinella sp.]|uniref:hypothetical protein n=1 Tax=Shinella sp. TaxID=1870904 RepID=UPI0029A88D76|nr:hypothetical protein [Shinella sp.]MDX3975199.1 hypothetical protein [Shinella sp.]